MAECATEWLLRFPVKNDRSTPEVRSDLEACFHKHLRNMTLGPLRNLLAQIAVRNIRPNSTAEARHWIAETNKLARDLPARAVIAEIVNAELRIAVQMLSSVTVGNVRNDVAHRLGMRPTKSEVEKHEAEVSAVIPALLKTFGVTPGGGQLIVVPRAG
jgi:hypothetical protein